MEPGEFQQAEPNQIRDAVLRDQLLVRREKLREAVTGPSPAQYLLDLLREVDAALERMEDGTYGICETCHDSIESERLLFNPICRNCLDHLSPGEQRALERDLDLAYKIQTGLLPKSGAVAPGWRVAYHYEPAGPVSGDYCDLIPLADGTGVFLLGDVTGKGVAASMMMAHLHAIFRSLTTRTEVVEKLVTEANRIFCEGTISSFFATLVCGRLGPTGDITLCNAGHCHPLHLHQQTVTRIGSTGLPIGLLNDSEYGFHSLHLSGGDTLVLFSDGLSETFNATGEEYGTDRLAALSAERSRDLPEELLAEILADLERFRSGVERRDDLTVMVIRREE